MKYFFVTFIFIIAIFSYINFQNHLLPLTTSSPSASLISTPPSSIPKPSIQENFDLTVSLLSSWSRQKLNCDTGYDLTIAYPQKDSWYVQASPSFSDTVGCEVWLTYPVAVSSPQQIDPAELLRFSLHTWVEPAATLDSLANGSAILAKETIGNNEWWQVKDPSGARVYVGKIGRAVFRINPLPFTTYHNQLINKNTIDKLNHDLLNSLKIE